MQPFTSQVSHNPFMFSKCRRVSSKQAEDDGASETILPNIDSIEERKILYYSDFDININDWKEEKERIKIFTLTLLERLRKH